MAIRDFAEFARTFNVEDFCLKFDIDLEDVAEDIGCDIDDKSLRIYFAFNTDYKYMMDEYFNTQPV